MPPTRDIDRALDLATEYADLISRGDLEHARVAERLIDELVGHYDELRQFVWPEAVAKRAGVLWIRPCAR